jgi:hypothetical protein
MLKFIMAVMFACFVSVTAQAAVTTATFGDQNSSKEYRMKADTDGVITLATDTVLTGGTITGGAFNGTVGATTPSTGVFTTLKARTSLDNVGASINWTDATIANSTGINWQDATIVGSATIADANWTSIDVNGGTIDGATIGASSASTGAFSGITTTGTFTSSNATTLGWTIVSSANTFGTSMCTSACVFCINGQGTVGDMNIGCSNSTADTCLCAGAN